MAMYPQTVTVDIQILVLKYVLELKPDCFVMLTAILLLLLQQVL